MDLLYALADYYVKRSKFRGAKPIAEKIVASHPSVSTGHDLMKFMNLVGIEPYDFLKDSHRRWVEASVSSGDNSRVSEWTQSIAALLNAVPDLTRVGSKDFVESTKLRLGRHAQWRKVSEIESAYQLREPQASYSDYFAPEKEALRAENTYFWNIYPNISMQ